jgi:hypothetical protein
VAAVKKAFTGKEEIIYLLDGTTKIKCKTKIKQSFYITSVSAGIYFKKFLINTDK